MKATSLVAIFVALFSLSARASFFTMPVSGTLFAMPLPTGAGGVSEFGLGSSQANFHPVFFGLPNNPSPNTELALGQFTAGTSIDFGIETQFGGEYFAFSNETTPAAIRAFTDIDNSLGLGGNVVESTGLNTYVLHLDDAASFMVDDNDADILMQLRAVPGAVPEPSSLGILAFGALASLRRPRR